MAISKPCPKCAKYTIHRSRSKNSFEKLVKLLLPLRTYRCRECHWRGWLYKNPGTDRKIILKNILFYIILVVFAFLLAHLVFG